MPDDPLRIAFAMINCNRRDGSARAVNEVAERLARRHDVHLFARKAEEIDLARIRWHRMPGISWPDFADFSSYHLLADLRVRKHEFDIVHSVGNNAVAANVITIQNIQPAKRRFMARVLAEEQTSFARKVAKWLFLEITTLVERRVYTCRPGRQPPLFLPVSRGVERELREHYEIGPAPVRVIPNAADTEVFRPLSKDQRASWRGENGFSADDLVMIFVGGEWGRKGLDLALHALALLQDPCAKLFIAGADADQSRFQRLAQELGIEGQVRFAGFRRDVATVLGASDLFLFPSWYEAFSLATIEAAACSLPVVASRINGAEDFVRPGENGEFIEHDPVHIATVVKQLGANRARLHEMGAQARRDVEANYTWDRVTALTEQAYREYLSSNPLYAS